MTLNVGTTGKLSGTALKPSYPFSMAIWVGGPSIPATSNAIIMAQYGTTGGAGSGGRVAAMFQTNNGKNAIDEATGWGGANAGTGNSSWGTTALRLFVVVFESASSRKVYFDGATPGTDSNSYPYPNITNHTLFEIANANMPANAQVAEFHAYSVALTDANVTALLAGTKGETLAGWIDGWDLKDYQAGGSYTSLGGSRTLTASGAVSQGTLAHPVTRGSPATAVTMSGPTSGTVGSASSNFTIGANGNISGTVVVTPSDGGAGGTFSPTTVSISAGTPTATFTYTAASAGAKTISVTNNGGLTNPSNITYTASAAAATAVTLSGPTSGAVGSPSSNFTVGANGAITGTVVVTPSDGGGGGTFSPTSVSLSSGSPTATFTYTPSTTGAKTISVTNNGSLTNPSNITYTASAAAATALTLSGPTTGSVGSPSSNFTVGANGVISGTVTVTPNDSSGGGTFTPTSVSISSGSPTATFTYTPGSAGAKTIGVTNNGSLTNPSTISYNATAIGTITGDPITDEVGNSQATVTIPKVVFMRISDMTVQLSLTNQVVNGSRLLPISNVALVPGVTYLRILCNADGTKAGAKAYTAS